MPRSISRAEQDYAAGTYGPFSINQFTASNAEKIDATLSVVGWPNVSPLLTVRLAFNTGGAATFDVSGEQRDENGALMPSVSFSFAIPRIGGVKKSVSGASVTVTAHVPIRTAMTLTAV